jgi:23S rRNA (cytosine1962-C5)-methyltransferase
VDSSIKLLSLKTWTDYELIDSGDYEKLEKYGKYVLRRPEPQAVWRKTLSDHEWEKLTDAWFKKTKGSVNKDGHENGEWSLSKQMPGQWNVSYYLKNSQIRFRLGLTGFKHVGIFPEQALNWDYIYDSVSRINSPEAPKVLNLFAYTGGASMAAKSAGADVTHVDSVKQVLTWARGNMESSNQRDIRWVCEDVMKFIRRETKRGNRYQGIILDPPAYGRGPQGEKWQLEENISELMSCCRSLSDDKNFFCVLNLYSMGFSSLIAENLLKDSFPKTDIEYGELCIHDKSDRKLPLSVFGRCSTFDTSNNNNQHIINLL